MQLVPLRFAEIFLVLHLSLSACSQNRLEPQAPEEQGSVLSSDISQEAYGNVPVVVASGDVIAGQADPTAPANKLPPATDPIASTPPKPAAVPPTARVSLSASCLGSFNLQVASLDNTSRSSSSLTGFNGCEIIAAKLNTKKLPMGLPIANAPAGPTSSASCNAGFLTILVMSGAGVLVDTINVFGQDICLEMRELIHETKI